jgi:hypothetical protein
MKFIKSVKRKENKMVDKIKLENKEGRNEKYEVD